MMNSVTLCIDPSKNLALPPDLFDNVTSNIKKGGLLESNGWHWLVIEKPFGSDLPSAQKLNQDIRKVFADKEIFRLDHYLGKEMVQNISVVRFANSFFESVWNNKYVANIQITMSETNGAAKVSVDNLRWAGVPFYIRTGKRLPMKTTEIVVEFKSAPDHVYFAKDNKLEPNLLVFRVSPLEGIYFKMNAKRPNSYPSDSQIVPVSMDFSQNRRSLGWE